jgi:hypothetical protein
MIKKKRTKFFDVLCDVAETAVGVASEVVKCKAEQKRRDSTEVIILEVAERDSPEVIVLEVAESDRDESCFVKQFENTTFDSGKLALAGTLAEAGVKLRDNTLIKISNTFTFNSVRTEFMEGYFGDLRKGS